MANPLDIAWAAGLFDGEGCISIRQGKSVSAYKWGANYQLQARVGMYSRPALERLQGLFGGKIYSYPPSGPRKRSIPTWSCGGLEPIRVFLQAIRPFSVVKLPEINLALEAIENWHPLVAASGRRNGISEETHLARRNYYKQLRELKVAAYS